MDILEAPRAQSHRNNHTTCAVHGRIDNVEVFLTQNHILIDHSFLYSLDIVPVHLTANGDDEVLIALKLHILNLHLVHLVDDTFVVRCQYLSTIIPISLVTIVLAWIVRSGDIHTSLTTELTDGERNFWCGAQTLEKVHLDAISREDIGYGLSKHASVISTIVTNYNRALLSRECFVDIVGKALCGHAHDVLVHTVGAGTHDATQTTSTKLQITIKCIDQISFVRIIQHSLNILTCLLIKGGSQPFLCTCFALSNQLSVICHNPSFLFVLDYTINSRTQN